MDASEHKDMSPLEKDARFRARRRLLQLGVYLTPTLLSLTVFLGQGNGDGSGANTSYGRRRPRTRVTVRTDGD